MRKFIVLGFLLAATAAQAQPSEPTSNQSGNILNGSHDVANQLPAPQTDSTTVTGMLTDAVSALQAHRTGEAQQALEQAETQALDRSVPQSQGNLPITDPLVTRISQARWALGENNIPAALRATQAALTWASTH
jgi:hypothetical protein